jgi:hypothetical protein
VSSELTLPCSMCVCVCVYVCVCTIICNDKLFCLMSGTAVARIMIVGLVHIDLVFMSSETPVYVIVPRKHEVLSSSLSVFYYFCWLPAPLRYIVGYLVRCFVVSLSTKHCICSCRWFVVHGMSKNKPLSVSTFKINLVLECLVSEILQTWLVCPTMKVIFEL